MQNFERLAVAEDKPAGTNSETELQTGEQSATS
jgi:hypothetical protein